MRYQSSAFQKNVASKGVCIERVEMRFRATKTLYGDVGMQEKESRGQKAFFIQLGALITLK